MIQRHCWCPVAIQISAITHVTVFAFICTMHPRVHTRDRETDTDRERDGDRNTERPGVCVCVLYRSLSFEVSHTRAHTHTHTHTHKHTPKNPSNMHRERQRDRQTDRQTETDRELNIGTRAFISLTLVKTLSRFDTIDSTSNLSP